jgi:hypothetical protein
VEKLFVKATREMGRLKETTEREEEDVGVVIV